MTPAPLPVIVGITGHRDMAESGHAAVAESLRALFKALKMACPGAIHVMSGLASGADLLAADIARDLDLALIAVAPMPVAAYRATLSCDADRARFDAHWKAAALTIELPAPPAHEDGYARLGALLARRSHVLVALWDGYTDPGRPPAPGGSADVVRMCLDGTVPESARHLVHRPPRLLDPAEGGCVLHVLTPRDANGGQLWPPDGVAAVPGACALRKAGGGATPVDPAQAPTQAFAAIDAACGGGIGDIARFNAALGGFGAVDRNVLDDQRRNLALAGGGGPLDRLGDWQATADSVAQRFQRRMLGVWVPARSLAELLGNGGTFWTRHTRVPPPGLLFGFAAIVPLAVLAFELYAHPGHPIGWLWLYLILFGGGVAISEIAEHQGWQSTFQDNRALAEGLRVQLAWALAGLPDAVADHYDRRLRGELGWIGLALRGPALWSLAVSAGHAAPDRDWITRRWIAGQHEFFLGNTSRIGKARLNQAAAETGIRRFKRFLRAGLALAGLLLLAEVARPALEPHLVDEAVSLLLVASATASAVAAFFAVSVEKRAYEAHAHAFAGAGRQFGLAQQLAQGCDTGTFRRLVLELGEEALRENAEWLLDHRRRPIKYS